MCGRYTLFTDAEMVEIREIVKEAERRAHGPVATGEDIRPSQIVPVMLDAAYKGNTYAMRWGVRGRFNRINAKAETVHKLGYWRDSYATRRCVIPTTGFYEWGTPEGYDEKTKFLYNLPGSRVVYLAGFYAETEWDPGEWVNFCTIITTCANDSVADVHERMPVALLPHELDEYLQGDPDNILRTRAPILFERMACI